MASREELEERERVRSYLFDTGREGTRLGMGNSVMYTPSLEGFRSSPEYISRHLSPDKLLETRLRNYEQLKLQYVNSSSTEERREVQNALQRVGDEINQLSQNVDVGGYTQQRSNLPDISSFNADNSTQAPLFETDNTSILSSLGLAQTSNDDTPPLKADAVTAKSSTPTLGASNTNLDDLSAGALKALGGAESVQAALEIAKAMQPKLREVDPALLAFQFFTNMAAESSKPGATALGAASTASLVPAEYLMQDFQARRKAESELPANAIQIAGMIKPPTGTGVGRSYKKGTPVVDEAGLVVRSAEGAAMYNYTVTDNAGNIIENVQMPDISSIVQKKFITVVDNQAKDNPETPIDERLVRVDEAAVNADTSGRYAPKEALPTPAKGKSRVQGAQAVYQTREQATATLARFGVTEESPEFNELISSITTEDPSKLGQPVIIGEQYVSFYTPDPGSDLEVILRAPTGGSTPQSVIGMKKRVEEADKLVEKTRTTRDDIAPTLEAAMTILMQNPDLTGGFTGRVAEIRSVLTNVFEVNSQDVQDQKYLEALSFALAPKMRPVGSGSTSDMEFKAYQRAILDLRNPGATNYLTMYKLYKQSQNQATAAILFRDLATQGKSAVEIDKIIKEQDSGIYEKFSPTQKDEKYNTGDDEADTAAWVADRKEWYNSIPDGAVILNEVNGKRGTKLFQNQGALIIKGWKGEQPNLELQ
jgi:hypothetical protein